MPYIHFMSTPPPLWSSEYSRVHPLHTLLSLLSAGSYSINATNNARKAYWFGMCDAHILYVALLSSHISFIRRINRLADFSILINIYTIYNKVFRAIYTILLPYRVCEYVGPFLSLFLSLLRNGTKYAQYILKDIDLREEIAVRMIAYFRLSDPKRYFCRVDYQQKSKLFTPFEQKEKIPKEIDSNNNNNEELLSKAFLANALQQRMHAQWS